jgi:hypothetical protein
MSFKELVNLVAQLITSWQVIVVTVVVFLYFFLVSYVARLRHRIKTPSVGRAPKMKKAPRKATPSAAEEQLSEGGDDLGIEEEE